MESDKKQLPNYGTNEVLYPPSSQSSLGKATIHDDFYQEDSPIEEVRSSIPPTDDTSLPTATFRSWFWGIVFSAAI